MRYQPQPSRPTVGHRSSSVQHFGYKPDRSTRRCWAGDNQFQQSCACRCYSGAVSQYSKHKEHLGNWRTSECCNGHNAPPNVHTGYKPPTPALSRTSDDTSDIRLEGAARTGYRNGFLSLLAPYHQSRSRNLHDNHRDVVCAAIGIGKLHQLLADGLGGGATAQDIPDGWVPHHFPKTVRAE